MFRENWGRMTRRKSICFVKNVHSWRGSCRSDGTSLLMSYPHGHPELSLSRRFRSGLFNLKHLKIICIQSLTFNCIFGK